MASQPTLPWRIWHSNCDDYAEFGLGFEGPELLDGGAVLDECSNFGVSGHSAPNFLAFNTSATLSGGGQPIAPETILFDTEVIEVQVLAAAGSGSAGGVLTMQAFNASDELVDSTAVALTGEMQPVTVSGMDIRRVTVDFDQVTFVLDDLLVRRTGAALPDDVVDFIVGDAPMHPALDVNVDGDVDAADVVSAMQTAEPLAPVRAPRVSGAGAPAPELVNAGTVIVNGIENTVP
jgi:hypothetical protein